MAEPFDRANWIRSYGWPTSESQALAQQYFQDNRQQKEVGIDRWKQMTGSIVTITRQDIADDREWYRSENFNRFFRVGRMDHMVNGKALTPQGDLLLLSLWRNLGDRPFTRRESRLLKLLLHEISTLYGKRLAPWHAQPGRQSLPPRQGQVLALLGKGLSEKEISAELKLSRHTVHDHVKALHRRFGVRSRGELLAELSRMLLEPKGTQI
jgi:DNA-binding CsgD family transcriptional regulator